MHDEDEADRGEHGAADVEVRVGSAGRGSAMFRLRSTMATITKAWKTNAARQLMAEVMRPPMSGPAAAPIPPRR